MLNSLVTSVTELLTLDGTSKYCILLLRYTTHKHNITNPNNIPHSLLLYHNYRLDDATKSKKRSIELNNGRAAQMGILGLMTHELMGNINELPIIGGN